MARTATARKQYWTPVQRSSWQLPKAITPSEWADENRVLTVRLSAEPGHWRTDRTPYLREFMDSVADPKIEEITLVKSTQIGGTEAINNILGYLIDQDPGPALFVMPTETDAKGLTGMRLRTLVRETPAIAAQLGSGKNDLKGSLWDVGRMNLRLAWAESDSSLASMPCRYVFLDELGKYRNTKSEVGADRVELAKERTRTFKFTRKIYKVSTPEDEHDLITREYERSDRRRYFVPCPHCGHYAALVFNRDDDGHRMHFDSKADPNEIRARHSVWFECRACEEKLEQKHKQWMLAGGVWCPLGFEVAPDGQIDGNVPVTSHRGYQIWAAYSPWVDWWDIAAEWLEAQGNPELLKSFVNNVLGEPWREKASDTSVDHIRQRSLPYESGEVPAEALFLTTGVDVQLDHFWFSTRAWGHGERSWLVRAGRVESWEQLDAEVVMASYLVAGSRDERMENRLVLIDSGYHQDEVYDFCRRRPELCRPTKGSHTLKRGSPFQASSTDRDMRGQVVKGGLQLWTLNLAYLKRKLTRHIHADPGDPAAWFVHEDISGDYCLQVTAEECVLRYKGLEAVEEWRIKRGRGGNHLFDCEVENVAAEIMLGLPYEAYSVVEGGKLAEQAGRDEHGARHTSGFVNKSRRGSRRESWVNR